MTLHGRLQGFKKLGEKSQGGTSNMRLQKPQTLFVLGGSLQITRALQSAATHLLVALLLRPESIVHRLEEEIKVWEIVQPVSPPRSDVVEPGGGHSCGGKLAH